MSQSLNELMQTINAGAPTTANDKGIVDRQHPFWQAITELASRGANIPANEIFISWTKGLKSSAGILWFHREKQRVYLQRRVQEQIGLGQPAKWAFPGGGFLNVSEYETPAQAAMRHSKNKMGIDILIPEYAAFHTIVKDPYGIANEGFTNETGQVTSGDIYGLVLKYPVPDDVVEACIVQLDATQFEVQGFSKNHFERLVENGESTLDPKEIDFIFSLFED